MEEQCDALEPGYPIRRLDAVDGATLRDCPPGLSPAQYGCWLSHLRALEQHDGGDHLHIMEDDALLSSALAGLPGAIPVMEASHGEDWDVLYLDATLVEVADMYVMFEWTQEARSRSTIHVRRIPQHFTVYGTHSYVVNARRREHVTSHLRRYMASQKPIDNVFAHGIQSGELKAFVTTPFVTSGTDFGSSSTIVENRDDRSVAWLAFRRLCFWGLDEPGLSSIESRLKPLVDTTERLAAVFGSLVAYRTAHWSQQHFPPAVTL
jgi:GR25 family glycosyltransferase involved in LPS biosynthesis